MLKSSKYAKVYIFCINKNKNIFLIELRDKMRSNWFCEKGIEVIDMISNTMANTLFNLEKKVDLKMYTLPNPNETLSIELFTLDKNFQENTFNLDINRKYLSLSKKTFQKRVQGTIVLRRIDFDAGHINPKITFNSPNIDSRISELMKKYESKKFKKESHIHFYIDGYNEKWAFPINEFNIFNKTTLAEQVKEFCKYCNLKEIPDFHQKDLLCMQ